MLNSFPVLRLKHREQEEAERYKTDMSKKMDMLLKLKNDITHNRVRRGCHINHKLFGSRSSKIGALGIEQTSCETKKKNKRHLFLLDLMNSLLCRLYVHNI